MHDPVVHFAALLFIIMVVSAALAPIMDTLIKAFLWIGSFVVAGSVVFWAAAQSDAGNQIPAGIILAIWLSPILLIVFWGAWCEFKEERKLKRSTRSQSIPRLTSQHARNL